MSNYSPLELEIFSQINIHRSSVGRAALTLEDNIQQLCRQHSQAMAQGTIPFGHDGFQARSTRLLKQIGGTGTAENIAQGQRSALDVVSRWLQSPRDRRNIEGDYNLTGIAVAKDERGSNWFTQLFLKWDENLAPLGKAIQPPEIQNLEKLVFDLVNDYRMHNYMAAFRESSQLSDIARVHSENMARGFVPLGHDGFQERIREAIRVVGGSQGAENVAMGMADGQKIVNGWLNSPGHKKNIDGNYHLSGMGLAKGKNGYWYFTQIFLH